MMRPVILVDVDGVIITGRPCDGAPWWTDLHVRFGFDKSDLRAHFFRPYWQDIVRGRDRLLPRLTQALATMESNATAQEVADFWFAGDARLDSKVCAWMDTKRAAGHRVMLASNQDRSRAHYLMSDLGLDQHCDGAYFSAALGAAKPEPSFYEAIQATEQRDPHDLILIDDTPANVAAAQAQSWQAYLYDGDLPDVS